MSTERQTQPFVPMSTRKWTSLVLILVFTYWCWAWSTAVFTADDYMFAARSGLPRGGVRVEDLLRDGWMYFWHVNGRLSDVVTQFILSSTLLTTLVPSLLHVAFTLSLYKWLDFLLDSRLEGKARWALSMGVSVLAPFTLILLDRSLAGDMYYFLAGTISTLGGVVCALWTLYFTVQASVHSGGQRSFFAAVIIFVLLGFMHELTSFFLIPACIIFMVASSRWNTEKVTYFPSAIILILSLFRLATPGMWRRTTVVQESLVPDADSYLSPGARAIRGVTHLMAFPAPIVLFLVVSLLISAFILLRRYGSAPRMVALLSGLFASMAWWIGGNELNTRRLATAWDAYELQNRLFFSRLSVVTLIFFFVVVISIIVAVIVVLEAHQNTVGCVVAALVVGTATTSLIPVILGNWMGRQLFYFDVGALLIVVVCLVNSVAVLADRNAVDRIVLRSSVARKVVQSVVTVSMVVLVGVSLFFALLHTQHVRQTHAEYAAFLAHLEEIRDGKTRTITVPAQFTYSYVVSGALHIRDDTPAAFKLYHELPETTEILSR